MYGVETQMWTEADIGRLMAADLNKFNVGLTIPNNPCGGGVKYLHRDPESRKRRRNGAKKKAAP
jgi:hypothetical protein